MELGEIINRYKATTQKKVVSESELADREKNLLEAYCHFYLEGTKHPFKLFDWNEKQIQMLLWYFCENPKFEDPANKLSKEADDYSLGKGLLLKGSVGIGKTDMMVAFSKAIAALGSTGQHREFFKAKRFSVEYAQELDVEYATSGHKILSRFLNAEKSLFLDDLGKDKETYHYQTQERICIRVLDAFYDRRKKILGENGIQLYLTLNITSEQLKGGYGERIHSRIYELCNVITYPKAGSDEDQRKRMSHLQKGN